MSIIAASRLRGVTSVNTIVGGVASVIPDKESYAAITSLSVSEITNFKIVGSDIQMFITSNYSSTTAWFQEVLNPTRANAITAFIDFDGKYISSGNEAFKGCNAKLIYTPNNNLISFSEVSECDNLQIYYSPKQTPVSTSELNNEVFALGTKCEFYTNTANETINNGSPDGDILELISNGGSVTYKDLTDPNQTTPPNAPTISTNTIGGTYVELNVSQPTHVNTLKYALVFVDGFFQDVYDINNVYALFLQQQTSYDIKVIIADEYFNISPYSNTLNVTTTTTPALFQNAVSYYKLDETNGDAIDVVSGYNGTLFGGVTQGVAGKIGTAYSFDGVDGRVNLGNELDFQLTQGSLSTWVKSSDFGTGFRRVITKSLAYGILILDNVLITFDFNGSGNDRIKSTGINIADNQWHHIVLTFNSGVTNETKIYLDGAEVLITTITVSAQTAPLYLGASENNIQNLNGSIDETFIDNTILTLSEISDLYNNGNGISI
jgi:hypothetical protein